MHWIQELHLQMMLPTASTRTEQTSQLRFLPNTFNARLFVTDTFTILLSLPFYKQVLGLLILLPIDLAIEIGSAFWPKTVVISRHKEPPDRNIWYLN